ncbi:thioredoxin family protein [Desulfofundulus thermocisternus]|uniref:thioredoxin family protein n=1 Tax=Desulfofundulus thermocisternus TaxID=42471 RepID=UPI00217DBFC0|nr:thioredoxin family protein [Desulfofundulus thermocisternus]MCS5695332.1 thioredoxin family protein [Desulfofundulus thermocisternus]
MEIKIFGPGCPKCKALHKAVTEVVNEMGLNADIKKVEKLDEIMQAGVMLTPGLMVNGKLKVFGRVPGKEDIKRYIEEEKQ